MAISIMTRRTLIAKRASRHLRFLAGRVREDTATLRSSAGVAGARGLSGAQIAEASIRSARLLTLTQPPRV